MTSAGGRPVPQVDLGPLGFDEGAHLLVTLAVGQDGTEEVEVCGTHPDLPSHLRAWARAQGHDVGVAEDGGLRLRRGSTHRSRWARGEWAGGPEPADVEDVAAPGWGLAPRGSWVEAGGPEPRFVLSAKDEVWSDTAPRLYARAAAGQWDPAGLPWHAALPVDDVVEDAVVQVMTFLVENEQAALVVPARFLGQVHPHFAEVQHVLAAQVADEARHVHVFSRRAQLSGRGPALSTVGGRASLQTLLDEPEWPVASFLLSVLGEGSFLALLAFLDIHAPDEVTRAVVRAARTDEARHVAFGVAHLERHCRVEPDLRSRLARAAERRHDALAATAGLNQAVFDSLLLLAAPSRTPSAVAQGWRRVQELQAEMADGRRHRLARLGFTPGEAEAISALHTRNFM